MQHFQIQGINLPGIYGVLKNIVVSLIQSTIMMLAN